MLTSSIRIQNHTIRITLDDLELEQAVLAYVRLRAALLNPLQSLPETPLLLKDTKFKLAKIWPDCHPDEMKGSGCPYTFVFESHSEEEA